MISAQELSKSLVGAMRLARGDPGGIELFDDTEESFWRSFWALVFAAPLYFVLVMPPTEGAQVPASTTRYFLVEGLAYVIGWFLWPLVMVYLARLMRRSDRYFRYIIAYNWAQVVSMTFLVSLLVFSNALFGSQAMQLLGFVGMLLILLYEWFIARTALRASGMQAAGLVALNFGIAVVLQLITDPMARG